MQWRKHSVMWLAVDLGSILRPQLWPEQVFHQELFGVSSLCDPMDLSTPLSFTILQCLLRFLSVALMMLSNHLILCHLLLLPSIPPSIRVFSNESTLRMRWPKYWSFSLSISPSSEWMVSFRMSWLDLLAVSRVFSNTSIQKHQFFGAQLSSQSNSHIHTK